MAEEIPTCFGSPPVCQDMKVTPATLAVSCPQQTDCFRKYHHGQSELQVLSCWQLVAQFCTRN